MDAAMVKSASPGSQHVAERPVIYEIGDHSLALTCTANWQWTVSIDDRALPALYASQAEAWEAGVREALGYNGR
jgi:hypothetical protein